MSEPTIGAKYPPLEALASVPLSARELKSDRYGPDADRALAWLETMGARCVGDLLQLTVTQVVARMPLNDARLPVERMLLDWALGAFEILGRHDAHLRDLPEAEDPSVGTDWRLDRSQSQAGYPESSGEFTIQDHFPGLVSLSAVPLGDLSVGGKALVGDDLVTLSWLRRQRLLTVGDVLGLRRSDIIGWRSIGNRKADRIFELLERISLSEVEQVPKSPRAECSASGPGVADVHRPVDRKPEPDLDLISSWLAGVAGAKTWSDALSLIGERLPQEVQEAADRMLMRSIQSGGDLHAVNELVAGLDPRWQKVLFARVTKTEPKTLEELGQDFGVSRERVRQIQVKVTAHVRAHFESDPAWRIARWSSDRLKAMAGACAPLEVLERALPTCDAVEKALLLWLNEYARNDSLVIRADFQLPNGADAPKRPGTTYVVDEFALLNLLEQRGVLTEHVDRVVAQMRESHRVDGQLLWWSGSLVERAIAVLELRDEPQSVDELHAAVGDGEPRSFRNRILEDERIMRVTKTKVGLKAWGGAHYTGVVDLMRTRLMSGPRDLDELAEELHAQYEISAASVRMYAAAPVFKVVGPNVCLRRPGDPFVPRNQLRLVPGLFLFEHRLILRLVVDGDMLRGSGRTVPQEVAAFLGIVPSESVDLENDVRTVPLSWSENSHVGPAIGSIRSQLEAIGAMPGDTVFLNFLTGSPPSLNICVNPQTPPQASVVDRVRYLTGLGAPEIATRRALASAIGVSPEVVERTLLRRGDLELAELVRELP